MALLAVSEWTAYRWSFEEDVCTFCEDGFDGVGIWRAKLSDFGTEKGIELLAATGMKVSSLAWAGGFTGTDGRGFNDSVADAIAAIRLAADLGAGCLVIYSGGRGGHTRRHSWRLLEDALWTVLPLAEELDVTLAIEPIHAGCAKNWTFLNGLDATLELLDRIDHPQLKMVFDTYHLGHDGDVLPRIGSIVPQIALVHVGDGRGVPHGEQNRCRLGEGSLPLAEMVGALCEAGYDGFFEIELMGEDIEPFDYRTLVAHAKRFLDGALHAPAASGRHLV